MTPTLFAAAFLAGAAYTLTPGPGFLMMIGIGASQGRGAALRFIVGHFAGDVVWSSLALAAIIGAHSIGHLPFDLLGLGCGLYLGWLGVGALRFRAGSSGGIMQVSHPARRGLMFGLTNPKAYPVAVATFTALLASSSAALGWDALPGLLGAACVGFLFGDAVLIAVAGAPRMRRVYQRHETLIVRASGVVFLGFAAAALANASSGLWAIRRGS
jgi:threonine/homoserine/homoserine lactone efflux protein